MELLAVGLAGCTAMDVLSILKKKRQDVTGFEVKVHAERAPDHPKVSRITIEHVVRGWQIAPDAVEQAIELSETKYCPAQAILSRAAPIQHICQIIEEANRACSLATDAPYNPRRVCMITPRTVKRMPSVT